MECTKNAFNCYERFVQELTLSLKLEAGSERASGRGKRETYNNNNNACIWFVMGNWAYNMDKLGWCIQASINQNDSE